MAHFLLYDDENVKSMLSRYLTDWTFTRTPPAGNPNLVARWGNAQGEDIWPYSLNRNACITIANSRKAFRRIMSLSGIPTQSNVPDGDGPPWMVNSQNLSHRYQVGVFDLSVIFFKDDMAALKSTSGIRSNEARRLKELAMRAVYHAGLVFGVVHVGIEVRTRNQVVIGVDPAPRLTEATAMRFAGGFKRYASTVATVMAQAKSRGLTVAIGADPEFSLANKDGGRVFASDYLPVQGPVGCELQPTQANGRFHKPVAELRPAYALSPVRLFQNLRSTIQRADMMIPPGVVWLAGSVPDGTFPTGGHIHFSRVPLSTVLLKALDNYLAIPLLLLEDPARSLIRRPRYGFLGDIRVKSHGGFEYRTPFSWLTSPVLALGALCLAFVIAKEHTRLTRDYFTDLRYLEAFYAADKGPFRQVLNELWHDLEQTAAYDTYKQSLDELKALIDSGWMVDESCDFRRMW
ncbi:MAG TPA: hypothetical protein GXZ82_04385 [Firmicutes bacterium]|jgi:hypothetical protein|nr:hypothetical protein [Bacillota bacterium]